jgi:hypothetical protein
MIYNRLARRAYKKFKFKKCVPIWITYAYRRFYIMRYETDGIDRYLG